MPKTVIFFESPQDKSVIAHKPISRKERVSKAEANIYALLNAEPQEFREFAIKQRSRKDGDDELDDKNFR